MKINLQVPEGGESVVQATVAQLFKSSGDQVIEDEDLLELETDKLNQVVYAPATGLLTLTVQEGDEVTPHQVIGQIDTDLASPQSKEQTPPPEPSQQTQPAPSPTPPLPSTSDDQQQQARMSVAQFTTTISQTPTPNEPSKRQVQSSKREKLSTLRKTIARRLVEAKNQTAMLTTFNEVDMSFVMAIRTNEKESFLEKHQIKLGLMSFFIKASTYALKEVERVGAKIEEEMIVYPTTFDISISVSTDRGLMVPVIRHCEELSFAQLETTLADYAHRARHNTLSIEHLQGGCFTITNGGVFGSMLSTPILNPPQSAILGMHNIVKRAVVINDQILIRPMMYLALSYDHRLIDGQEAITFLNHIKTALESPERLLLET